MKPQQIIELEKHLGFELTETENPDDILYVGKKKYVLNDKQEVIGLNLYDCNLEDISFLQGFTNLIILNLSVNQISDIFFLKKLTNLFYLDISFNIIVNIEPLRELINLKHLSIDENEINNIPHKFFDKHVNLNFLSLNFNPLNIPEEIYNQYEKSCLDMLNDYWNDVEKGKTENKELKIIFIGNGSVGKTQIAKRLCEQDNFVFDTQHNSTHAIALLRRELAGFELNCWDFAGQDLYHATHRVFMQTRALLVLVWDYENETKDFYECEGKKYENEKLLYWLEYAKCFAPESPILVLQNKTEKFPQDLYFEKIEEYKKEYPIIGFLQVSANTGEGFKVFERQLKKAFHEHSAFKTPPLPTNWVEIRKAIRQKQENGTQKTLSFNEFTSLCQENDCEKSTTTILGYLHDTGVLYYREGYFSNQIILNQDWAIQAIYQILNRESEYFKVLESENGKLDYELICEIWVNNSDVERRLFIDFMLSAELCFETTENKKYDTHLQNRTFAVPQLFKSETDSNIKNDIDTWKYNNSSNVQKSEISYRFLPKVFIQRFIVKANRFSEVRLMWQKGLLLKTAQGSAVVEACYEKEQQRITIISENELVTQKIKEELADIAKEGTFRSKEGKAENSKEKFGLNGLNLPNNRNIIWESVQAILEEIDNNNLSNVFEMLDDLGINTATYNQLKQEFIIGASKTDIYYIDRLRVFVKKIK